jgi:hypothetical protein
LLFKFTHEPEPLHRFAAALLPVGGVCFLCLRSARSRRSHLVFRADGEPGCPAPYRELLLVKRVAPTAHMQVADRRCYFFTRLPF